ncbi:hypothetical protein SCHPADRAFT_900081 [Schizopora paradoxa]|uniref:DUF7770 domain-containing protein n=1 Tax=Schizopora paradoxa TaxID=27342 RepID=A0A0H2SLZ7_9AGAM|nr:hypothetical protein SCHPADRAFT_900081 [Schizopora paradoxa]
MATNYVFGVFWTPGPSGCRYWCTMVLRCMERVGFVQMGSATGFEQYIYILNSQDPVKYPLPLRKGIFLRSKSMICHLKAMYGLILWDSVSRTAIIAHGGC